MKKKKNNKRGFTLLVAMLVSSMVIVVGLGVSSIVLRQFNLAVLSRESQAAFYIADTLVECLFYWDLKAGVFSSYEAGNPTALSGLACDSTGAMGVDGDVLINITPTREDTISPCAATDNGEGVKISKTYETNLTLESSKGTNLPMAYALITRKESCVIGDPFTIITTIDVNGYNSSRVGETRRIERGLSLTY